MSKPILAELRGMRGGRGGSRRTGHRVPMLFFCALENQGRGSLAIQCARPERLTCLKKCRHWIIMRRKGCLNHFGNSTERERGNPSIKRTIGPQCRQSEIHATISSFELVADHAWAVDILPHGTPGKYWICYIADSYASDVLSKAVGLITLLKCPKKGPNDLSVIHR